MFLETIKTEGLGHLSCVIGDNGKAAVIELLQHPKNLPWNKKITTVCASGKRAMIAASLLKRSGLFKDIEVCLGAMSAFQALDHKRTQEAA